MTRGALRSLYSLRFVAAILLAAFAADLLVMVILQSPALEDDVWAAALLDAAVLVVVLLPALYFFVVLPLERQVSQRQLSEERLASVVDNAQEAIIVVDEAERVTLFNQAAERTFGCGAAEALGQPVTRLLPAGLQALRDQPSAGRRELTARRLNGKPFPAEAGVSPLLLNGHTSYTIILRDITERRAAETALREARDELELRVRERTAELADANRGLQRENESRLQAENEVRLALEVSRERQAEIAALLAGSRTVLDNRDFENAARAIVTASRALAGAGAGCILMLADDHQTARVRLFEGGAAADEVVDLAGLARQVSETDRAAYDNAPAGPAGWPQDEPGNLLFAPLRVNGTIAGLLGLAGKPGGFADNDVMMAAAFAELAAIALRNSQTLNSLETLAAEMGARANVLDAVFAAIADAVFVFDAQGGPLRVNPAAVTMYGGAPENALRAAGPGGPRLRRMNGRPVPSEALPAAHALRGETVKNDYLHLSNLRGRDFTIAASASPLYLDDKVSGAVMVWHDVTEHERLTALEERQRLARELHDSLSQALYGISLGAHTALDYLNNNTGSVADALHYVLSLAELSLIEMRALIFELRPESLALEGLVSGLLKQAAVIQARTGFPVNADLGEEPSVSLEIKEACLRIAQEAINNSVRHARAGRLNLRLTTTEDRLTLEVDDDGAGFDPAADHPGHLGLTSMRERAALVGGSLTVTSARGQGTRVRAEFPVERPTA